MSEFVTVIILSDCFKWTEKNQILFILLALTDSTFLKVFPLEFFSFVLMVPSCKYVSPVLCS